MFLLMETLHRNMMNSLLQYRYCSARLKTFSLWPKHFKPEAIILARSGFIYLGKSDRVQCFSCGLILCDWKPEDDPYVEHFNHQFTNCDYLNRTYIGVSFDTPDQNGGSSN